MSKPELTVRGQVVCIILGLGLSWLGFRAFAYAIVAIGGWVGM